MSCLERRDLYLLYLTDGLEASETAELRAHLATGCPTCAAAMAEAQATLDLLPHALDPVQPPASAWAKLSNRVAVRTQAAPISRSPWRLFAPVLALAASIIILISGIFFWMQARQTSIIAPDMQMITLAGTDAGSAIRGRVLLSATQKRCQLSLADLPPPPAGRTYELWIITDSGAKIPAGTFDVDTSGKVAMATPMPEFTGTIKAAAVTDEPPGGVSAPTGSIRIYGDIK